MIADNGEGVWNATGKTLRDRRLSTSCYETVWFRAVGRRGLVALVWPAWRYRIAAMRRAQAAQQAFSRQLIASEERERQRIAAELHDSLGQNLLVVKNRALLGALAPPDGEARKQFDEIGATVAQTLAEVRTIAYDLRPHHLEQLGLTTTIRAMVEKSAESSGIVMIADLDDLDGVFPPEEEITIYRIIQESVNNVIKHANAREARIAVRSLRGSRRDHGEGRRSGVRPGEGAVREGDSLRAERWSGRRRLRSEGARGTRPDAGWDLHDRLGPWPAGRLVTGANRNRADRRGRAAGTSSMAIDIRILIADDRPIFRQGLRQVIDAQPGLTVVAEAADGDRACSGCAKADIAVAVLDVTMPLKDGFAVAARAREHRLTTAIVFLTMHRDEHYLDTALDRRRAGLRAEGQRRDGDRRVHPSGRGRGRSRQSHVVVVAHSPPHARGEPGRAEAEIEQLTATERRILRLVADGLTSREIAGRLAIGVRTVEHHRNNVAVKLARCAAATRSPSSRSGTSRSCKHVPARGSMPLPEEFANLPAKNR